MRHEELLLRDILVSAVLLAFTSPSNRAGAEEAKPRMKVLWRKTLSTRGSTRGTAYAMSNKIITANGKIFVAWLDHVADIRIQTYDTAAKEWGGAVLLGKGKDNHSGPAVTMDSEGYLHAVFGPHQGPFQFRRSARPYDAIQWTPVERFGVNATYPSLICGPDDTLHCTYRGGPMPRRLMYQRRPKGGEWSQPREIVNPGVKGGYTQYGNPLAISADNTLHLAFHIYDHHPAGGKSLGYLRSRDGGDTWETADGREVEAPVNPSSPCFIEQSPSLDMRVSNVALGPDGWPHLIAWHSKPKPASAKLWRHDGQAWESVELLAVARTTFPKRGIAWAGTLTFDRDGRLYIAAVIEQPPGGWGHASQEVILLTSDDGGRMSEDGGQTFDVLPISTVDPKLPCWLPSIERPFGPKPIGTPSLLYTHGGPGIGCTKGDATEIVFVRLGKSEMTNDR